ncbi:UDP-N-acetylmuramoyl-L-alanyl-D-glutamate--2,6-diaminopimelate ligase [Janthinobacterium sp. 17J80-10]|uniref:UDP-N-acetylmuramoyl-L-alanyl-D-glutamate--2, 6-diaminopimelate ligase n=1 Tax=Janthinobacterium sp. 17J80-10 TaxID=2497863 RepID=UPI001005863B|nr:UDP-N-acetylmuramoyl-L-alanyl-D-glutamate--2,6-diaminopimelate ligase [Janthinobacterium sp. 17J80-10]QAU33482.1 UDP-N-acetylmuramoyl-L-alanyl-D-glutamate--2,6-diaminopimelate ligase [Janthinobacterium sp. 17J80-10]
MIAPTRVPQQVVAWLQQTAPQAQLAADSRAIAAGDVFFAYPGDAGDGRRFIAQAIAAGAAAVVYETEGFAWDDSWRVPQMAVAGLKAVAGEIACGFYGGPDRDMFVVAVTGTNGKTSCTQWLGAALSQLGTATGVIGTLGNGIYRQGVADNLAATGYTTPDAVLLQRSLDGLRQQGAEALAIEASSIGLEQGRMAGMHVDVAVFTNLTRDHLDYHGDMAAYEASKAMLFDWPGLRHAVINLDDDMGARLVRQVQNSAAPAALIGFSLTGKMAPGVAVLQASDIRSSHAGTTFALNSPFGSAQVKTRLVGNFNVSNVLAIIGCLLARGIDWSAAIAAVEFLVAVPGRMQQLGGEDAPLVVIDYAHTPDALEKTLAALRPVAQERQGALWCVFGCGGDRDPGKRPQMGKVSMLADHVIVTSDNPRSEAAADIIAQIMQGMEEGLENMKHAPLAVEDRAGAILRAVRHAEKNDVILLAGKGHESTQEIKGRKLPFLDADHAALALATRATHGGAL